VKEFVKSLVKIGSLAIAKESLGNYTKPYNNSRMNCIGSVGAVKLELKRKIAANGEQDSDQGGKDRGRSGEGKVGHQNRPGNCYQ